MDEENHVDLGPLGFSGGEFCFGTLESGHQFRIGAPGHVRLSGSDTLRRAR
jgi:hypothetical protein